MGFWGKALGISFGFMFGGPLGAIIGGVLGHMYDVDAQGKLAGGQIRCPRCGHTISPSSGGKCTVCGASLSGQPLNSSFDRQFLFYVSLAALAAKMAKADGVVTEDEIRAFDNFLRLELKLPSNERKIVARLFNEAKKSPHDASSIAYQFRELLGYQPDVFQMLIHLLFRIAMADGRFHPAEERYIKEVANTLGLTPEAYEQIRALFVKDTESAYRILGLSSQASDEEIRKAYKKLVMEFHPDKLIAKGVPEDFIKIANEKMAEINLAYDQISKERGL